MRGESLQISPQPRFQYLRQADRLAGDRRCVEAAAGTLGVTANIGGNQVGLVGIIAVERAPRFERLQQHLLVLCRDFFIEPALRGGLGEQLGHLSLEIGLDGANTLRLAAERAGGMQQGIVIELDERLDRDIEALAVVEQRAVMIRNPPRPGIEIKSVVEFADLLLAAELDISVAAAQCPVATARPLIEFQHRNLVSGLAQLERRGHAGETGAEDHHGRALGVARELDRALVSGVRRKAEAGHGVIHRRAAGERADQRQQVTPTQWCGAVLHRR